MHKLINCVKAQFCLQQTHPLILILRHSTITRRCHCTTGCADDVTVALLQVRLLELRHVAHVLDALLHLLGVGRGRARQPPERRLVQLAQVELDLAPLLTLLLPHRRVEAVRVAVHVCSGQAGRQQ